MRCSFLILLSVCVTCCYSQMYKFQKTYGVPTEDANAIGVTSLPGGEFLVSGVHTTSASTMSSVFVMKLSANGDTIWTKKYRGTSNNHYANGAAVAGTGFVVFGGTEDGSGMTDLFTLTIDSNGDTIRTFTYGGTGDDYCTSGNGAGVEVEGDYVFCGQTMSYGAGLFDCYLVKTDFTGSVLWSHAYGGVYSEQGGAMVHTSDSGFVCTGLTTSFGSGGSDVYLLKTDSLGNLLWAKSYGLSTDESAYGVTETSDRGFIITGMRIISPANYDAFLLKTDSVGNLLWVKQYGNSGANEWGSAAIEVSSGGYAFCGRTGSYGNGSEDMLLIRTDAQGDTLWTRAFGGPYNDYAYSVTETAGGGFVVAGGGPGPTGVRDQVYIIRTDANGYSGCFETAAPLNVTAPNFIEGNANMVQSNGCISTIPTWQTTSGSGQQSFCFSVDVEEETELLTPDVYPVPANDYVTIVAPNSLTNSGNAYCIIVDVSGREILRVVATNPQITIDVTEFNSGLYFCRFESEFGVTEGSKFLVD